MQYFRSLKNAQFGGPNSRILFVLQSLTFCHPLYLLINDDLEIQFQRIKKFIHILATWRNETGNAFRLKEFQLKVLAVLAERILTVKKKADFLHSWPFETSRKSRNMATTGDINFPSDSDKKHPCSYMSNLGLGFLKDSNMPCPTTMATGASYGLLAVNMFSPDLMQK